MISIRSHCAPLLLAVLLLFSSCEPSPEKLDITIETDYSRLVAAIENVNKSLSERMALLEGALESGLADSQAAVTLVRQAVETMGGSLEDKLVALEEAVKSQTTSLETKLAIIEAAMNAGFADEQAQQVLLQEAIASMGGSLEEKMAALETAMKNEMTGLETKMDLMETAVQNGLADNQAAQELLKEAVESLGGTMETKLAAIDSALASQQTTLSAKLALIETAVQEGFAGEKTQQELIQQTLESLGGSLEEKLTAIEEAMGSQSSGLETKLELIDQTLTKGFADDKAALGLIASAVSSMKGSVDGMDRDIDTVVATLGTLDPTTGTVSAALTSLLADVSGMSDYPTMLAAIEQAVGELEIVVKYTGHAYVDMGNGLKWATMNVGARQPEEYGDFFAWGETSTKDTMSLSKYFDKNYSIYNSSAKKKLDVTDDAARENWGGSWRMPTDAEYSWLIDNNNCSWAWTDNYQGTGVKGAIVTSTVSGYEGNQIFFPAAGFQSSGDKSSVGAQGNYWSVSLESSNSEQAKCLQFLKNPDFIFKLGSFSRYSGLSVRPVAD